MTRVIGVWCGTLRSGLEFVNEHLLGDNVVNFVPDGDMPGAMWLILRVTRDEADHIRSLKMRGSGKLTVI